MQSDALALFLRAREPESTLAALRSGGAPWRSLASAMDDTLKTVAVGALRRGQALVATGSYGRRELTGGTEVDLLLLAPGDAADAVNAALAPLWDRGVRIRHTVRPASRPFGERGLATDVIALLDARFVCGDEDAFEEFAARRRTLVRRGRGALRSELRRRHGSLVANEPWQTLEPHIVSSRGGLESFLTVYWTELADALAADRHGPSLADPAMPLAAEYVVLLRALTALNALREQPDDLLRRDDAETVARLLAEDEGAFTRRLLLAMRAVDAAAGATIEAPRGVRGVVRRLVRSIPGFAPLPEPEVEDLQQLIGVLRGASGRTLDPVPPAAWLTRLLPEWEVVRALPPPRGVHQHPVDSHLLRTVSEAMRGLTVDTDNTSTPIVAAELADQDELLLAALLHDIGSGHEGDHALAGSVIAERFAARAGLSSDASRRLVTVVEHHRLLATASASRDIADGRVIADVATAAGDPATLHLLYLVAVADARATGPEAWSGWRAAQLRTLYVRALHHMTGESGDDRTALERRHDAVMDALVARFSVEAIETHLSQLPPRYLLAMAPETVGDHLAMIAEAADAPGRTAIRHDPLDGFERLTVVTSDRPGILALVAGTLALHQVSVLGGNAYARGDGTAIEVFHVTDPSGVPIDTQRWTRIADAIPEALEGRLPVDRLLSEIRAHEGAGAAPRPTASVQVDNSESDAYSIVEVRTLDRLGLLYAITHALYESGLDIHLAKVDTIGHEVADAFYVLRRNGRRIEAPDEIERVCRRVQAGIAALDS